MIEKRTYYLLAAIFILNICLIIAFIISVFNNEFIIKSLTKEISPLDNGNVLHLSFNEIFYDGKKVQVQDLSENNHNAVVYSATWNSTGGPSEKGAFEFDGKDDKITIKDNPSLSPSTTNNFAVSFWVKFDQTILLDRELTKITTTF